jgi:hypothetical protein
MANLSPKIARGLSSQTRKCVWINQDCQHRKADYDYQTTVATVVSVARRAKDIFQSSSEVSGKRAFLNYLLLNPTADGKSYILK